MRVYYQLCSESKAHLTDEPIILHKHKQKGSQLFLRFLSEIISIKFIVHFLSTVLKTEKSAEPTLLYDPMDNIILEHHVNYRVIKNSK
jgi:hypothetical protein